MTSASRSFDSKADRSGWASTHRVMWPLSAPSWSPSARPLGSVRTTTHPSARIDPTSGTHHPRLVEPVTDAADGLDELAGFAQLLSQALDVNVDRSLQDNRVLADRRVH